MTSSAHRCSRCGEDKPVGEFSPSIVARKTGGYCRACRKLRYDERRDLESTRRQLYRAKPQAKASRQRWNAGYRNRLKSSPELAAKVARLDRASGMLRRYGITLEQYDARLSDQGGRCACCGSTDVRRKGARAGLQLFVDHDHATGEIRGLVCHKCNAGIAQLGDTAAGVRRALSYLEKPDTAGMSAGLLY